MNSEPGGMTNAIARGGASSGGSPGGSPGGGGGWPGCFNANRATATLKSEYGVSCMYISSNNNGRI